MRRALLIGTCWLLAWLTWPAAAQPEKHLWVLREPGEAAEFVARTFAPRRVITVPVAALQHPERLSVNASGQMLYVPDETAGEDVFGPASPANRVWLWNGREAVQLDRGAARTTTRDAAGLTVVDTVPFCFLSSDGRSLYWFANEFRKRQDAGGGVDRSVTTVYRVWQTDLSGGKRRAVAEHEFPLCACATGVSSETCPEGFVWAPEGGIDDCFVLTHWIPGQLGATFSESFLYRRVAGVWRATPVSRPLEQVLDASSGGNVLVSAIPDSGCCGWDNDSDDQTLVIRGDRAAVVFDERTRYGNVNYDVSFYTPTARLSPDLSSVAMTIAASARAGDEIRLASEGRADPQELDRIRRSLARMPAVEVISLNVRAWRSIALPHTELVGWLDTREILVLEGGVLVSLDVSTGRRRTSRVGVSASARVFLR